MQRGAAAATKPQIQHSKFKNTSGRSLRRDAKFGNELRASAGQRLRSAAVPCRNRKFSIQNSKFKIKSGRGLRRSRTTARSCVPPPGGGCGPTVLTDRFQPETSPQPSGRACDHKEQPSARGRLRAAGRCATEFAGKHVLYIASSCDPLRPCGRKFKMKNEGLKMNRCTQC